MPEGKLLIYKDFGRRGVVAKLPGCRVCDKGMGLRVGGSAACDAGRHRSRREASSEASPTQSVGEASLFLIPDTLAGIAPPDLPKARSRWPKAKETVEHSPQRRTWSVYPATHNGNIKSPHIGAAVFDLYLSACGQSPKGC